MLTLVNRQGDITGGKWIFIELWSMKWNDSKIYVYKV